MPLGFGFNQQQSPYGQQAGNIIQQGQAHGLFNPMGSPAIRAAVRAGALRNADNARRRSAILSRLMGLDPNQARVAAVGADTEASGQTQNALGEANLSQLLGGQQFARGLFGGQLGNEQQRELLKYQHELSNPGIGQYLGQLAGYALPGIGSYLGGRRRQSPVSYYPQEPINSEMPWGGYR